MPGNEFSWVEEDFAGQEPPSIQVNVVVSHPNVLWVVLGIGIGVVITVLGYLCVK